MIGHYKRSKWMAEQEVLREAKEGAPIIVAMPTTPVGPWDWKPTPTGKIILDFLNGKMPGYVDTGLNFVGVEDCAAGHLLVSEKGKPGERYLLGAENLTLKGIAGIAGGDYRVERSDNENPAWSGVRCSVCGERVFTIGGERAADTRGRREDRAAQNVRGCVESEERIGI